MSGIIDKLKYFRKIIQVNGGLKGSWMQLYRTNELKIGTVVGEDRFGNKYYENNYHFMGRNRWVDYNPNLNMEYDASQVPAEWHRWLHYITDDIPTEKDVVRRQWMDLQTGNTTGSKQEYVPYSTAKPKVQSWSPPSSVKK